MRDKVVTYGAPGFHWFAAQLRRRNSAPRAAATEKLRNSRVLTLRKLQLHFQLHRSAPNDNSTTNPHVPRVIWVARFW